MRNVFLLIGICLIVLCPCGFSAPPPSQASAKSLMKVGYVDVRKVFDACTATQQATLSLKKEIETKQQALANEEAEIAVLQKELREKEIVLSEIEKKKRQKEIEDKIAIFQKRAEVARQELMLKERQMTESIIKTIQDVITEIAKEEGFSLILEKDSILYGEDVVDLTGKVIGKLNKTGSK